MSRLDLTGIHVFCEIVESGSFTAAGNRLGMAPPMVSKHLARLEQSLSARLLNRTSRSMSLTEAGRLFHEQARQALDALDAGVASLSQSTGHPRGELKVSAPVWIATPRFANLLAEYRRACPDVRLDFYLENRMVDVVSEGFDLALRMKNDASQNLISRSLCSVSFYCVATPAYLSQFGKPGSGSRLPEMIMPNHLQFGRPKMPAADMYVSPGQPVAMKSSDTTLSYHAVMAGMGAAFLPDWIVADDLAAGRLVHLDEAKQNYTGQLFAVYPSRRHLPAKLRSFIDFLVERLDNARDGDG
ncbi:DNA-binding transcriptional LysR family regulator [Pseudoduganella flava]|uniref:DNA-binding transcriptional LysR family regulator n=1 Tax=Pseudoduganella flava TaxID=871742 RepID=A0A562PIV2_9BURK|nr:LysR family transcriptional regulator [Pseudoduganella flava]QGZ41978.1 LysR family transcriptional regulator [Pseudoduganella flava]TWI44392.1 DNA-binding transcriptional LysR family regulator [Pseudoduganella flava]